MVSHDIKAEAQIFVSYSRRDAKFAQWLVDALSAKGFAAYLDKVDIAPGEPWQARLADLILASDTVVFVVTANSVASPICAWELDEAKRLNKRIFPLAAERIPDSSAPSNLRSLNWISCADGDDRTEVLDRLDHALRADLPWIREHTRLTGLASRWHRQGRARALTLRGSDLNDAEEWLGRRPAELARPTDLHRDFIQASRRAATVRQRWFGGAAVVIVAFSLLLAGWAEVNRRDAQLQRDEATVQRIEAETQRDRAEEARRNVELQRDRAEKALENVADLGGSLYIVTASTADLLGAPVSDKVQSLELIQRLISLGDELAVILSEQKIQDKPVYLNRARSLRYAAKYFALAGKNELAVNTGIRSVQIAREVLALDRTDEDAIHVLAEALQTLGDIKWPAGDAEGAEEAYAESLRVLEDSKLDDVATRQRLASAQLRMGFFYIMRGDGVRGKASLRIAIKLLCRRTREEQGAGFDGANRDLNAAIKFAADNAGLELSCL